MAKLFVALFMIMVSDLAAETNPETECPACSDAALLALNEVVSCALL